MNEEMNTRLTEIGGILLLSSVSRLPIYVLFPYPSRCVSFDNPEHGRSAQRYILNGQMNGAEIAGL